MPLRFGVALSLAIVALTLIACGEDSETVRVTDRYTLDMLGAGVSLTEERCDSARMGQLLYVGDSSSIYYCTGKVWKKINGSDGRDGRDGKDGADGTDGKRGKYGTSGNECSIDGFSEGFVLGCGATKAVVRYNFELPDTCSIKLVADSSYVLACGDENVTLIQGPQGAQGASCVQTDIGEGRVKLVCGNDSVTTYKAQCGETPFDPDGSQFCYGDTLVERCNMHIYDIQKQFCYSDSLVDLCGGKTYELKERFCYQDSLIALCGGKSYDPKEDFCSNDSMVTLCGGKPFDVSGQFCYGDTIVALCGGEDYDLALQFCYSDSLVNLCGGKSYGLKNQFCYNDSLVDFCTDKDYDLEQQFCYNDSLVDLCGGKDYDLSQQFCWNDSLVKLCGRKYYDLGQKFCYNDSLVDLCGGRTYDLKNQFCYNDSLIDLCGGKNYTPTKQFCYIDSIVKLCGTERYDLHEQFCFERKVIDFCEGDEYDAWRYFCYNDSLVELCKGESYDLEQDFCYNDELYGLCEGETYDPKEYFCEDGVLYGVCNGVKYGAKKLLCDNRNGKLYRYTVIGGVAWMAENLDFKVPDSFCDSAHKDNDVYCGIKGRFYPWNVAMARSWKECGAGNRCMYLHYPYQGVCPDGWHLPTIEEWSALRDVMGEYDIVYWDTSVNLHDRPDASSVLTDKYGFSAIPTGIVDVFWDKTSFKRRSDYTIWSDGFDAWSSTEADEDKAYPCYFYTIKGYNEKVRFEHPYFKESTRTVRCVRD